MCTALMTAGRHLRRRDARWSRSPLVDDVRGAARKTTEPETSATAVRCKRPTSCTSAPVWSTTGPAQAQAIVGHVARGLAAALIRDRPADGRLPSGLGVLASLAACQGEHMPNGLPGVCTDGVDMLDPEGQFLVPRRSRPQEVLSHGEVVESWSSIVSVEVLDEDRDQ